MRVAGLIGIYPVFDFRTYPKLDKAAAAYGLTPEQLSAREAELNPIERVGVLAAARVPAILIHGDKDTVVPLEQNSAEFVRRYKDAGAESLVKLIVLENQGHSFFEGFFHSQQLVDFAIAHAKPAHSVKIEPGGFTDIRSHPRNSTQTKCTPEGCQNSPARTATALGCLPYRFLFLTFGFGGATPNPFFEIFCCDALRATFRFASLLPPGSAF